MGNKNGRPPVPTAIKKLRGNPGRRPFNEKEPRPTIIMPSCPTWLNDSAKKIFIEKAKELFKVGILTRLDIDILSTYSEMMADFIDLKKQIENEGRIIYYQKVDYLGNEFKEPKRNPNLVTIEKLRTELRYYSTLLGLNPSARTRLQAIEIESDKLEDFLGKK